MSAANLYQQIVLDHHRTPRHHGVLSSATHCSDGHNPLCGDHLRIELQLDGDVVIGIAFSGEACAITTATASMMSARANGLRRDAIDELSACFEASLRAPPDAPVDPQLGDLSALSELRRYPARLKCALLPWVTLRAALDSQTFATTEISDRPNP